MSGFAIGMTTCYIHGGTFGFDPETVVTMWIDPQTKRPPDVGPDGAATDPGEGWKDRCVQVAVCDKCIETTINPELAQRGKPLWPLAREQRGRMGLGQSIWDDGD